MLGQGMNFWASLETYADQPRVPAGSPEGGEWTAFMGSVKGSSQSAHAPTVADREIAAYEKAIAETTDEAKKKKWSEKLAILKAERDKAHAGKTRFVEGLKGIEAKPGQGNFFKPGGK